MRNYVLALGAIASFLNSSSPQSSSSAIEFIPAPMGMTVSSSKSAAISCGPNSTACILTFRVENLSTEPLEALTFELTVKKGNKEETHILTRAQEPFAKRIGRPILPKESKEFQVLAPVDVETAKKSSGGVVKYEFFRGKYESKPLVKIAGKTVSRAHSGKHNRQVAATTVKLENLSSRPVDATFLAKMRTPKDVQTLFSVRLQPKEKKDWVITETPGGPNGPWPDADIEKLELIDWCEMFGSADEPEPIPTRAKIRENFPESGSSEPPKGSGVQILREAWNATYRFPDQPLRITGQFAAENPGTDMSWQNQRKVEGRFVIEGFHHGVWRSRKFEPNSADLGEITKTALGDMVVDRLGMWFGRDMTGRSSFERTFGGATITKNPNGSLSADLGPWRNFVIERGKIAGLSQKEAPAERRVEYVQIGSRWVPSAYRSGDQSVLAEWSDVGNGVLFPTSFEFRDIFGKGWGPEKITLSGVKAELEAPK